jgi:hypothetical protein
MKRETKESLKLSQINLDISLNFENEESIKFLDIFDIDGSNMRKKCFSTMRGMSC